MRCTCDKAETPHHHAFGGTYPCPCSAECRRCSAYEERVWRDSPLPVASPASMKAARQRHTPREH